MNSQATTQRDGDAHLDDSSGWLSDSGPRSKWARMIVVAGGIVLSQCILYGPSLVGTKLLLPLGLLATPGWYLPPHPPWDDVEPQNPVFSDQVLAFEFRRRFAAREVRAGRLPLWNPYNYCGAPFMAANNTAVFSPFRLPSYLFPGPRTLAWVQLLKSLFAGFGAYLFFRRGLNVGFWPAAFGGWCFPLIGFLVLFAGFPPSFVVVWLPWVLLAVDASIRNPGGRSGVALASATALMLVSGHLAVAALVLLGTGIFFLWRWGRLLATRGVGDRHVRLAAVTVVAGWALGMLLSAPQSIPTAEYLSYSDRVQRRNERGVVTNKKLQPGLSVAPQLLLPYFYGTSRAGSAWLAPDDSPNRLEGAASGYAGLLVAMVLAPLGWCSGRRGDWVFWFLVAVFSASYTFDLPGIAQVFNLPLLRLLNHNRLVFLTAWSLLCLGVLGLDAAVRGGVSWRWVHVVAIAILLMLGGWCIYRMVVPPPQIARDAHQAGLDAEPLLRWFRNMYLLSAGLCMIAIFFWVLFWQRLISRGLVAAVIALAAFAELIVNSYGVNPQNDPSLYYPRLGVLERLESSSGRICGFRCLPSCLNQSHALYDIRGYDGVDPVHLVQLLGVCKAQYPGAAFFDIPYAAVQYFPPVDSPIIDMLNVRYRLLPEEVVSGADVQPEDGFYVFENDKALPRAYVPKRVEKVADEDEVIEKLSPLDYQPREVAFVTEPLSRPFEQPAMGEARIQSMLPSEVVIDAQMQTAGLVVLSDLWFPGWKVTVDDRPAKLFRVNHAFRGVEVAAGRHEIRFRYRPASFTIGLLIGAISALAAIVWCWRWPAFSEDRTTAEEKPSDAAIKTDMRRAKMSKKSPRKRRRKGRPEQEKKS